VKEDGSLSKTVQALGPFVPGCWLQKRWWTNEKATPTNRNSFHEAAAAAADDDDDDDDDMHRNSLKKYLQQIWTWLLTYRGKLNNIIPTITMHKNECQGHRKMHHL
jgi:hypothetical protein